MNVTVIGTGFVGVVTSAVLASFGNRVYGLDVDEDKIEKLKQGRVPFFEPGLEKMVQAGIEAGNLSYTSDYAEAVRSADVIMIAVGTPSAPDGTADLKYVFAAAESLAPHIKDRAIVAIKSTVPPGTNQKVAEGINRHTKTNFFMASLPEFLREGSAVQDTLHPDRVVVGASDPWVIEQLLALHHPLGGDRVIVSPESAQMAKYTANAYLAQRITFINQIANLCEKNGAHISEVIGAIGYDKRIGSHYWYPGLGYGGSCFPKDVKELAAYAKSVGEGEGLLVKIDELNDKRIDEKLVDFDRVVGGFNGKTVAVLGLSFKPNTNDMRFAPSLRAVPFIVGKGGIVRAYDPEAVSEAKKLLTGITYCTSAYEAVQDADVVMLLVEWKEFVELDLGKLKAGTKPTCWLIDTRNQFNKETAEAVGFAYLSIGNS